AGGDRRSGSSARAPPGRAERAGVPHAGGRGDGSGTRGIGRGDRSTGRGERAKTVPGVPALRTPEAGWLVRTGTACVMVVDLGSAPGLDPDRGRLRRLGAPLFRLPILYVEPRSMCRTGTPVRGLCEGAGKSFRSVRIARTGAPPPSDSARGTSLHVQNRKLSSGGLPGRWGRSVATRRRSTSRPAPPWRRPRTPVDTSRSGKPSLTARRDPGPAREGRA